MTTRQQRITDAGRKACAQDRVDLGHHRDDLALYAHATELAQSNIDDLEFGGDNPQADITEFVTWYVAGYQAEVKFSAEMQALGESLSAERQTKREQALAEMTPEQAIQTLRSIVDILYTEEYMAAAEQARIIAQWLERQTQTLQEA